MNYTQLLIGVLKSGEKFNMYVEMSIILMGLLCCKDQYYVLLFSYYSVMFSCYTSICRNGSIFIHLPHSFIKFHTQAVDCIGAKASIYTPYCNIVNI